MQENKKQLFKYSKDRRWYINLLLCFVAIISIIILPTIFNELLSGIIKSKSICNIASNVLFIIFLYLLYFKDLNFEFKLYFKNFISNLKISFRYYGIGLLGMIVFNMLIMIFLKEISSNESQVREMLFSNVFVTMISISIIAPLSEEIIFRKSIQPIIKNKWLYALVCGVLFGGAHILTNILSNDFILTDLIYILPYGCLGASFALMDYESKTTFSSIFIHAFHNTLTGILLLVTYYGGYLG